MAQYCEGICAGRVYFGTQYGHEVTNKLENQKKKSMQHVIPTRNLIHAHVLRYDARRSTEVHIQHIYQVYIVTGPLNLRVACVTNGSALFMKPGWHDARKDVNAIYPRNGSDVVVVCDFGSFPRIYLAATFAVNGWIFERA